VVQKVLFGSWMDRLCNLSAKLTQSGSWHDILVSSWVDNARPKLAQLVRHSSLRSDSDSSCKVLKNFRSREETDGPVDASY